MKDIKSAPNYIQKAHELMVRGYSTREMADFLKVSFKTAGNYRNRVNRIVGFNRPWEKR